MELKAAHAIGHLKRVANAPAFYANLAGKYAQSGDLKSAQEIAQSNAGLIQVSQISSTIFGQTTTSTTVFAGAGIALGLERDFSKLLAFSLNRVVSVN